MKIRVWDKENKRWDNSPFIFYPQKELRLNNRIIQLSTGLKDENGKDIFEGDIITYRLDNKDIIVIITWQHYGFYMEEKAGGGIPLINGLEYTIIGNIFESKW